MHDTADYGESIKEHSGADVSAETAPAHASDPERESARAAVRGRGSRAGARAVESARREALRLVCAATFAVALGAACGLWISARLASAASTRASAAAHIARLLPDAGTHARRASATPAEAATQAEPATPAEAVPPTEVASPTGDDGGAPSASDEATPRTGPKEPAVAEAPGASHAVAKSAGREWKRGVRNVAPEAGETSPTAKDASPPARTAGTTSGSPAVGPEAAARARGAGAPCALYASAGSLTLRAGGAATLVLGGPGERGRVAVSTPDWADIAVFSEGPTGGAKGWLRYTVRSVGKRPGVYAVHFKTPCGSQTVPVTVGPR